MNFHDALRATREAAGLTQKAVAEHLGIERESVGQWENGRTLPNSSKINELCRLLNTTPNVLFGFDEPGGEALPAEAVEVARAWLKLKEPRRGFWRDSLYLEAAVSQLYPWLALGKPEGDGYDAWERQVQRDMVERLCGISPATPPAPKKR
jgi:transcriptional regulator with XRE-family HTH domain